MLKLCSLFILCLLLCDLTVSDAPKNNVNKQTKDTSGTNAEVPPDGNPIRVMEGQPPSESVKPKKVVVEKKSKSVPRKGVINPSEIEQNSTLHDLASKKVEVKKTNLTDIIDASKQKTSAKNYTTISMSTEKIINVDPLKKESSVPEVTTPSTTAKKKPKPKPIVTVGGEEPDGPIPPSPTRKSPVITPTKYDYIVPVLITITALPLLGIAFHALYKRGRDYWSKRHYRRMDFLIDGMYNE